MTIIHDCAAIAWPAPSVVFVVFFVVCLCVYQSICFFVYLSLFLSVFLFSFSPAAVEEISFLGGRPVRSASRFALLGSTRTFLWLASDGVVCDAAVMG